MSATRREFIAGATAFSLLQGALGAPRGNAVRAVYENGSRVSDFLACRRLHLDICGRIPTPEEVTSYVSDRRNDKYEALVDRLLGSADFADYWSMRYCDILRVKSEFPINLDHACAAVQGRDGLRRRERAGKRRQAHVPAGADEVGVDVRRDHELAAGVAGHLQLLAGQHGSRADVHLLGEAFADRADGRDGLLPEPGVRLDERDFHGPDAAGEIGFGKVQAGLRVHAANDGDDAAVSDALLDFCSCAHQDFLRLSSSTSKSHSGRQTSATSSVAKSGGSPRCRSQSCQSRW